MTFKCAFKCILKMHFRFYGNSNILVKKQFLSQFFFNYYPKKNLSKYVIFVFAKMLKIWKIKVSGIRGGGVRK